MSGSENWLGAAVELLGERFCVLKDGCGHRRQKQGHCAIRKRRRTGGGRKHRRRSMQRQDGFGREERDACAAGVGSGTLVDTGN